MADDMQDQRHRRRLFGRRRSEAEGGESPEAESPPEVPATDRPPTSNEPATTAAPEPPGVAPTTVEPPMQDADAPASAPSAVDDAAAVPQPEPEPEPGTAAAESVPASASASASAPTPAPASAPAVPEAEPTPNEPAAEPTRPSRTEPAAEPKPTQAPVLDTPDAAAAGGDGDEVAPLVLPRVIAIANQKGGVGKTTTAVNLGAALAEADYRVVVVDLDPQGNATTGLGVNPRDVQFSIYDVIMNDTPAVDAVEPTSLKNLFVIPATLDLAGAEIELVPAFSREQKLKRALDTIRDDYDILLIDCPPSLGLLTVNGLAAADDVIVPIQCEYYALEGLGQLLRNVASVRNVLNPTLDVRGIVLTMHDTRTRLADQVETEVREHFGTRVYKTVVPRTVRLAEAPSFGQPIIVFDPTSRGAKAYRSLAKEVSSGATRRTG